MTAFADQLMVRYMDPANVDLLLVPQAIRPGSGRKRCSRRCISRSC